MILTLSLCVAFVATALMPPNLDHDDIPILKEQGNRTIQRIEDFRETQGHYPADLDEVGIEAPPTRYGRWRYHVRDDAQSFKLSIGEYRDNSFTLFWDSEVRHWYLDT